MCSGREQGFRLLTIIMLLQGCIAVGKTKYFEALEPVVTTSSGKIQGKYGKTSDGNDVTVFFGIPFAEPPLGENRFKKPVPVKPWDGTYDATKSPPPCMQLVDNGYPWIPESEPSEDCLFLNIWVPGKCGQFVNAPRKKLSVMIWIFSGGYYSGSSEKELYDGSVIATTGDVIVASMNYRVGSFGFLTSGSEDAPGNMGLLDQTLAIEWIKKNIANFGGDPESITLFGQSAGSVSAGLHMISPKSRNLFGKAIMHSGSPYHPALATPLPVATFKSNLFATSVGCADLKVNMLTQPDTVVQCLKEKDAKELAKAESIILTRLPYFFLPIYGDEFLPQSPLEALDTGNFRDIPVLMGVVKDEGAVFMVQLVPELFTPETAADLNREQARMVIMGLFLNNTQPPPNVVADYYLNDVPENDNDLIVKRIHDSFGDFIFVCPSLFFAEKIKNIFFYNFTHRPSNTRWGEWMGTTHFDDVAFVFGEPLKFPESYTPEEVEFSRNIIQKLSSFAKTGTPYSGECTNNWPKFTPSTHLYKELNPTSFQIGTGPHLESCNFWRNYWTPQS